MMYPRNEWTKIEQLAEILQAIQAATDEQLCYVYDRLIVSLSAPGAALGFFAGAARICLLRPHLAERVLREPINALVCLGIETPEQVASFLRLNTDGIWFEQEAGLDGIKWLVDEVPKMTSLLARLLAEEIARNS